MENTWDKMDPAKTPTSEAMASYADNPLWDDICGHMETQYQAKPVFEYSRCSVPGWNVTYKKAGRSLCRLYPFRENFIALVVIGKKEKTEFDLALPSLTTYTQTLFETTKDKNGLCWLMFEVGSEAILNDVKRCIAIRRGSAQKKAQPA